MLYEANLFKKVTVDLTDARTDVNIAPAGGYFKSFTVYSSDATTVPTGKVGLATDDSFNLDPGAKFEITGRSLLITHGADAGKTLVIYFFLVRP